MGLDGFDEVYAVFADFNPVAENVSTLFGDVDSGETRTFQADDSCLAPQPKCDHGASSLHFAFSLWEEDRWGFADWFDLAPPVAPNSHVNYEDGLSGSDDLIGRHEVNLSQAQLVTVLPAVGSVIETTVKPTGGSGSYAFTYRITRLANVERTIVIHEPQTLGISLQASLQSPPSAGKVSLTWSGATSPSVDILRGAALIGTTANDGQYTDNVSGGTYQYRVCEAGMTTCSATVTITVP